FSERCGEGSHEGSGNKAWRGGSKRDWVGCFGQAERKIKYLLFNTSQESNVTPVRTAALN
ncbi:MAG: hypothetical protein KAU14_04360, partial [Thermoplasmata archaeon]|nr:hypothetical protein [Thermoplasmata archaeon]